MKKRRIIKFVTCIVLVLSLLVAVFLYATHYKNTLVILCNENEITEGLYKMYMITEAAQLDRSQYESDEAFWQS